MPIRINLLAEEQAAEEMRRRDPIKRAIYAGAGLAGVMLFWIGITQMNVIAARRDLSNYEYRLAKVDESSKQVRANQTMSADFEAKLKALHRYATNRLLWGTMLDALQFTMVDNIRLTELRSDQTYGSGEIQKFFTTNLTVTYIPPSPWWKVWSKDFENPPLNALVEKQLSAITNKAPFLTNTLAYSFKVTPVSTNAEAEQIQAKVEFSNPIWNSEKARIEIRGRDYRTTHGAAIDELMQTVLGMV